MKLSFVLLFLLITKVFVSKVKFGDRWSYIGPFITGKTEIDADPLQAFAYITSATNTPCTLINILRKVKGNTIFS